MVVVGTHAAAPRSPRGPILGWVDGRGLPWPSCAIAAVLENPPHGPLVMFGSITPFPVVPFPSLMCPRPWHVHCCRMVLGPVAMSQPSCQHALPVDTSPGSGRAVPKDMGAACALRGKTPGGHHPGGRPGG